MPVSRVEIVVLGLLAEEPLHGYQLLERHRSRGMNIWAPVGRASVYQALRRLEDDGAIAGSDRPGEAGPERRVFRLTGSGRSRLQDALVDGLEEPAVTGSAPKVALGFAHLLPRDELRRALALREEALTDLLDAIEEEMESARGERGAGRAAANRMLELEAGLARAELASVRALRDRR